MYGDDPAKMPRMHPALQSIREAQQELIDLERQLKTVEETYAAHFLESKLKRLRELRKQSDSAIAHVDNSAPGAQVKVDVQAAAKSASGAWMPSADERLPSARHAHRWPTWRWGPRPAPDGTRPRVGCARTLPAPLAPPRPRPSLGCCTRPRAHIGR